MGAVCCCLQEDYEDYVNLNSSVYRNCICFRCFVQNFMRVYTSLFRRGEGQAISSTIQGGGSLISTTPLDNTVCDMYRPPPRPLPYNVDPRYSRLQRDGLQRDGLVSRREKGSSHSHEETEPLRSEANVDSVSLGSGDKGNELACEEGLNESRSIKLSTEKPATGYAHIFTSQEDEDVCPTCLEEYTVENPKIMMKCSHHYHLVCIYEWMERSESCPVCGKVMVFDESK